MKPSYIVLVILLLITFAAGCSEDGAVGIVTTPPTAKGKSSSDVDPIPTLHSAPNLTAPQENSSEGEGNHFSEDTLSSQTPHTPGYQPTPEIVETSQPRITEEEQIEPCPCPEGGYCLSWRGGLPTGISAGDLQMEYLYTPNDQAQFKTVLTATQSDCYHFRLDFIAQAVGTPLVMSDTWIQNTRLRVLVVDDADTVTWRSVSAADGSEPTVLGHIMAVDNREEETTLIPFSTVVNIEDRGGWFMAP